MRLLATLPCLMLAACAANAPITNAPANTIVEKIVASNPTIASNLQDAASNLDNAISIGVLPANDPADTCVHTTLQGAGIEPVAGAPAIKSFTPKTGNPLADGSVLYIRAQQAKAQGAGTFTLPQNCYAIIGKFVIDGITSAATVGGVIKLQ